MRAALVDEGRHIAISSEHQLIDVEAASFVPRGMLRARSFVRIQAIPNGSLFVARSSGGRAVVYDAQRLEDAIPLGEVDFEIARDGSALALLYRPSTVLLWDVRARAVRWRITRMRGFDGVRFADGDRLVVAHGEAGTGHTTMDSRTGAVVLEGTSAPAPSPDSRVLAHVAIGASGPEVQLVDRATGTVMRRSTSCPRPFAVAFDSTGTRLAVGAARSVCVLDVATLSPLRSARTESGPEAPDGSDRVTPTYVSGDTAIFAGRRDHVAAVLDASTLQQTWSANGSLVTAGSRALVDNGTRSVAEIGPGGRVTVRPASDEELTMLGQTASASTRTNPETDGRLGGAFCRAGGWVLPSPCP